MENNINNKNKNTSSIPMISFSTLNINKIQLNNFNSESIKNLTIYNKNASKGKDSNHVEQLQSDEINKENKRMSSDSFNYAEDNLFTPNTDFCTQLTKIDSDCQPSEAENYFSNQPEPISSIMESKANSNELERGYSLKGLELKNSNLLDPKHLKMQNSLAKQGYEVINILGEGSFSKVYLAKNQKNTKKTALKIFNKKSEKEKIKNEYNILKSTLR